MRDQRLGRTLAVGIAALAAFNTVSNLSMPVADRRPSVGATALVAVALVTHAILYWFGDAVRQRVTLAGYVGVQAAIVFFVALMGTLAPVVLALYVALTVETVLTAGTQWGAIGITTGAIVLFAASASVAWGVYRATTVGLLLAAVGVLAHAIAALVRHQTASNLVIPLADPPAVETNLVRPPAAVADVDFDRRELARLTAREREVLRALASGARTTEIAEQLDIAERTVKAHLANIYQKLGVESRTAAVAVALQNRTG